ncbi:MAG: hypothetical protein AAF211_04925 [Myxococcota bacterium]
MQTTWDEWKVSPAAAEGLHCPDCHDHRARGAHDARHVRRALRVDCAVVGSEVHVTLTARGVGHRLPTGDITRNVEVVSRGENGVVLGARRLGRQIGGSPVRVWRDTRLEPDVPVTLRLPEGEVAVFLNLVAPAHAADLGETEARTVVCDPCPQRPRRRRSANPRSDASR